MIQKAAYGDHLTYGDEHVYIVSPIGVSHVIVSHLARILTNHLFMDTEWLSLLSRSDVQAC